MASGKSGKPGKSGGDLLSQIEDGTLLPIYCLHGEEHLLIDRCVKALRRIIVGGEHASPGMNFDTFELKESGLVAALATANTLPMLATRRLVIARGVDLLRADDLEPLIAYAANPNPKTCLVLLPEKADKVDGRLRVFLALKKAGYLHELGRLPENELPRFVAHEAKRLGFSIDAEAADALAAAAGPDLGRLSSAVGQLGLLAADPAAGKSHVPAITRAHVETLIPESREHQIFELTRALAEGDPGRLLHLMTLMFHDGERRPQELAILLAASFLRQIRQIWRAREHLRGGGQPRELASALGIPPFAVDELVGPAERMSGKGLFECFASLYRADRELKSSRMDPELLIRRLVLRLGAAMHERAARPA